MTVFPQRYLLIGTLLVVIVTTRFGGLFSFPPSDISTFWPPNAILLAALLLMDAEKTRLTLVLSLPAYLVGELWIGFPPVLSLIFSAANCLEVMIGIYLIRHFSDAPYDLGRVRQLAIFGGALLFASIIGGFIGAAGATAFDGSFPVVWLRWASADFQGYLAITPILLTFKPFLRWLAKAPKSSTLELAVALSLLILMSVLAYGPEEVSLMDRLGAHFLPIPILLWIGLRFGPPGAAISTGIIFSLVLLFSLQGHGPFTSESPVQNVQSLQLFISSLFIATLTVAAVTSERNAALSELSAIRNDLQDRIERQTSELKESVARFRSLVEAAPVCIHEIDGQGRLASMNRAGLNMMGAAEESEVCGLKYLDVPVESDQKRIADLMEAAYKGESSIFEFTAQGPDGPLYFESCFAPIRNERNEIDRLMGITQDITQRKTAELDKENALQLAEQATKAKSEFLATMSHELRTPLNAVLGFAQMISTQAFGAINEKKYVEYAQDIESSGKHLLSIIGDILDLSKIEAKEYPINPTRFELLPAISDAVSLIGLQGKRSTDRIRISISEEIATLHTDLRSFRQILINLLSNAVKYSEPESEISITAEPISDDEVTIRIADQGVGIPDSEIKHVLEPFGQARVHSDLAHEGTGLGLSLSKNLMENQGGSLEIESRLGAGTTVTLVFRNQTTDRASAG